MRKVLVIAIVTLGLALTFGCKKQGEPKVAKGSTSKGLERIHFDFDRSDIKPEFKKVLDGNAGHLKDNPKKEVVIEGHCDERGSEEYNIALGHRRSKAAKDYLVSLGVDKGRLTTKSFGEEKTLESCHNESCWWKNRRAEFAKK
jgi:peptidoglycan-associated lipoprotein